MSSADSRPWIDGRRDLALLVLLTVLAIVPHLGLLPYAFDDAYIHLRVARHLVDLGEPYFNTGEPVMASSAPVWSLLLAALFVFTREPWLVAALNAFLSVAGAMVYLRLLRRTGICRTGGWLDWIFAVGYLGVVHYASAGLMEIPLALLVLGAGVLLYAEGSPGAFAFLALAPFVRLELAVFFVILLVHGLWRRRLRLAAGLRWGLVGGAPLLVYQLWFFETLVPHTAAAKARVYELTHADSLRTLIAFSVPELPFLSLAASRWIWLVLTLTALVVLAAAVLRTRVNLPREELGLAALLGGLLIGATYVATAGLVFPWYPPLVVAPVIVGALLLSPRIGDTRLRTLVLLALLAPSAAGLVDSLFAATVDPSSYRHFRANARVGKYLEIGARLHERYPRATLLSSEVGGLGYAFEGRVIDGAGIVSPAALEFHPMAVPAERRAGFLGAIPVGFVRAEEPELIVSLDIFAEAFARDPLSRSYDRTAEPIYVERDLARLAAPPVLWGSRHIQLWVRSDLADE